MLAQNGKAHSSATVRLEGEYDLARREELKDTLAQSPDIDVLTVDMSGVEYIDSTAIGCFIAHRRRMVEAGGEGTIRLMGTRPNIQRLLSLCGLDRVFELTDV